MATLTAQVVDSDNKVRNLKFTWDSLKGTISATIASASGEFKGKFMGLIDALTSKTKQLFVYWTAQYLNPYRLVSSLRQVVAVVQ